MRNLGLYLGTGAVVAILGVVLGPYREQKMLAQPLLPVAFVHADHISVNCVDCHHDFNDESGLGTCFACHKSEPELVLNMQEHFHNFCRGCHVEKRLEEEKGGPLRRCGDCHVAPASLQAQRSNL